MFISALLSWAGAGHAADQPGHGPITFTLPSPQNTKIWDDGEVLLRSCRTKTVSGKDIDDALADCEAALKLDPDSDDAKLARGFIYLRTQRYAAAMADYRDVLRHRPNSPTALFGLGQAGLKSGVAGGGQAELAVARARNPSIDTDFDADLTRPTAQPMLPRQ